MRPYIPKQNVKIPDYYGIKVLYINGASEEFEGYHSFLKDTQTVEIVTKDDIWSVIPICSLQRIEFDKRFSQLVELRNKERFENANTTAAV